MEEKMQEKTSRREALKKAGVGAAFITPALLSFKVAEVKANASKLPEPPAPPGLV